MAAGTRAGPSQAFPALVGALHSRSSVSREGTAGPCQPSHPPCAVSLSQLRAFQSQTACEARHRREGITQLPPG